MAEEPQQVTTKEPQGKAVQALQVTQVTKEPQRVTTKNSKKLEASKKLAVHNHKKREERRKEQAQLEKTRVNQYYGIGAVIALGVISGLGYYIYQTKKGQVSQEVKDVSMPSNAPQQPSLSCSQSNKFEMD